ncbi:putative serine/threonine-protein kinase YabT [Paenibacillus faecis]|uniref:protein kinase domain-containing protein n=1 Tax=Paenibacillus faecis TaxID=862114 RepID=UPI001B208929|nr:serine/threonine protein kinase [Paenibacillus faecis]GIO88245.1 putative serine/threonine-protein kinase YabT [Paenibacillus faecis]
MTTSSKGSLAPGTVVTGRWKGRRYAIQRLLGQGANGVVYLVKQVDSAKLYALKMGFDTVDIQSEVNVLKALQRQRYRRGVTGRDISYLVEVDDYSFQGREIPFYVMRYVKGEPLRAFLAKRGGAWLGIAGLHLLRQLRQLHDSGWVFGDLKPENVLVSPYGEVELIDYGGVSGIGRSVKQFTEWYDRGYWGAGGRTAEPSYDWFSFAVVCIHLLAEGPLKRAATQLPQTRSLNDLTAILRAEPALAPFREWLERALAGRFKDTAEACELWRELATAAFGRRRKPKGQTPRWMLGAFAVSLTLLVCALYLTLRF